MKKRILAIDPGSNCFGVALFEDRKLLRYGYKALVGGDWFERLDRFISICSKLAKGQRVDVCVVEKPQYFGNAASNSDAILKLFGMVIALRVVIQRMGIKCVLVPVLEWKGTLPKEITQRRIRKRYNWKGKNSDEADAIGIGDYYVRQYDQRRNR